ncbi:C-glycoside deglycosidase beta subunit domain-containing protein [Actinoplanes sp. CA-142083]|uniref:C-glycoside deglycosidase beta subunit domain-containing protein n=1 Tax=Actinoplanes sp. CA-142083 TaxID=3239903 RepID=UPI003D94EDA7
MMPELIIEPETFKIHGDRVRMSVRMPWYRALPLSSVADVRWTVDGRSVPRESITWTVDGETCRLDELPPRHDKWWYVLDSAVIEGDLAAASGTHEVAVTLALYIPYITTDHGVLLIEESDVKEMAA